MTKFNYFLKIINYNVKLFKLCLSFKDREINRDSNSEKLSVKFLLLIQSPLIVGLFFEI